MAGATDAAEALLLDHIFSDPVWTPPATWYLAVSSTTPTEAGGNFTEPVGNNYARIALAAADWAAAVTGQPSTKTNLNPIQFLQASGSWGLLTHFGLFDALTVGNLRFWGPLGASKSVAFGDTAAFAAGTLIVQLGDPSDTY
jgi:hypothetical protein